MKGCKTSFTRHPETENSAYDEKVHKRTVDLVPAADLRTALEAVSVKVLGAKESSARIASVTDSATGLKDGTLTIGDDIIIEGEKLKIDEKDSQQGVFFCYGRWNGNKNSPSASRQQAKPNRRPSAEEPLRRTCQGDSADKVFGRSRAA